MNMDTARVVTVMTSVVSIIFLLIYLLIYLIDKPTSKKFKRAWFAVAVTQLVVAFVYFIVLGGR